MTDEDRKLIFEFGGFSYFDDWYYLYQDALCISRFSSGTDPDMDWYFKYAVPKLSWYQLNSGEKEAVEYRGKHIASIAYKDNMNFQSISSAIEDDPTEAFGQALLRVIKKGQNG